MMRVLFVLGVLGLGLALAPERACACSTVESAYRTSLRSALHDISAGQRAAVATTGRLLSQTELLQSPALRLSPTVRVTSWEREDDGLRIRVGAAQGTDTECSIALGPDGAARRDTWCTPYPQDTRHTVLAVLYFALLALAIHGRYTRAGRGLPPASPRTLVTGVVLGVVHPFWDPLRSTEGCRLDQAFYIPALLLVAGAALYAWKGPFRRPPEA